MVTMGGMKSSFSTSGTGSTRERLSPVSNIHGIDAQKACEISRMPKAGLSVRMTDQSGRLIDRGRGACCHCIRHQQDKQHENDKEHNSPPGVTTKCSVHLSTPPLSRMVKVMPGETSVPGTTVQKRVSTCAGRAHARRQAPMIARQNCRTST